MKHFKEIRKVTLIQAGSGFFNLLSNTVMPRYGIIVIGTILKDMGYDVQIFVEDISPINWERVLDSDLIGFKVMSCTHNRTREMIEKIKGLKDIPVVLGGTHATYMTDECLEFSDFVIRKEGDESLPDLIKTLNTDGDLSKVLGLSYKNKGRIIHNPDRPPVEVFERNPDISLIQGYPRKGEFRLLLERRNRILCLQTSRGCPFNCKFCPASKMFGKGYRVRSIDSVIRDIRYQMEFSRDWSFLIVDNNFAADAERTKQLLKRIIDEKIKAVFAAFVRLDVSEDEELLRLFRKAGVKILYLGLESLNDATLKKYMKGQTRAYIEKAVSIIKKHDIEILGSFALGADDDTKETVRDAVDFAISHDLTGLYMFCLIEFPLDSDNQLFPLYRIFQYNWDYSNGNFVLHFPKRMKPSTLQREIMEGQRRFYTRSGIIKTFLKGTCWRGLHKVYFRYMWERVHREVERYIPYLENIEQGYYDENEELLEAKLQEDYVNRRGVFLNSNNSKRRNQ